MILALDPAPMEINSESPIDLQWESDDALQEQRMERTVK